MTKKKDDVSCLININKKIVEQIDFYRKRSVDNRTSWIIKAVLDKLRYLNCDVDSLFDDESKK